MNDKSVQRGLSVRKTIGISKRVELITSERTERSFYYQSYIGHLDDIQKALNPLKKSEKFKYIFMTILGLAELIKTMNWPGLTLTLFDGLFLRKYKR